MTRPTGRPRGHYSWGTCDTCGGALPLIDGDNNHPALPSTRRTGGECPGYFTRDGVCGAYRWSGMTRFARRAKLDAQ